MLNWNLGTKKKKISNVKYTDLVMKKCKFKTKKYLEMKFMDYFFEKKKKTVLICWEIIAGGFQRHGWWPGNFTAGTWPRNQQFQRTNRNASTKSNQPILGHCHRGNIAQLIRKGHIHTR